jgi:putative phage-type endonuclease
MSKMKIIDINQRSGEWLKWRSEGVTATDVAIILGLSPYKTPWQLWAEKVGRINSPDISGNPNIKRGIRLEDEARQMAEVRYGEVLLPLCGECARWDILRASFDGLDTALIPYEFKAPSDSVWEDLLKNGVNSSTYKLYEAQVLAQCVVAGATTGKLIFYKEGGLDQEFLVSLSPEKELEILEAAKTFWEHVVTLTPPKPDPLRDWYIPVKGEDQFKWDAYSDAWRTQQHRIEALKDELKVLEKVQKANQSAMITLMGPFMQADIGGVKVTRFTKKGSIDYAKFLESLFPTTNLDDELESFRKTSREECRFSKSEDELVNVDVDEVVTTVKSAYF